MRIFLLGNIVAKRPKDSQKYVLLVCHLSDYPSQALINKRKFPIPFLRWLGTKRQTNKQTKKWGKDTLIYPQQILKPSHSPHPYSDLCYQRMTEDLAECSMKNASVRNSSLLITWLCSQGTETLPQDFSKRKHVLNFK